jgi:hypothetical protein
MSKITRKNMKKQGGAGCQPEGGLFPSQEAKLPGATGKTKERIHSIRSIHPSTRFSPRRD